MQTQRIVITIASAIALSLTLTACDPPMPESLRIAQAEQEVQCETGNVSLSIPEVITDVGFGWTDSLTLGGTQMTITNTDEYVAEDNCIIGESSLMASR